MVNLWLVIQREFVSNVLTSRFMIGFIVCLLSTVVAVFVQIDDYEKRLVGYNTAVRESQSEVENWELYTDISLKVHRKPNPLGIFYIGMETSGVNAVVVEPDKPIWKRDTPSPGWGETTQKIGADNPFLSMFLSVDVVFIFKIVLSALAILFAYNTISGEREDGTLKLVLSNAIPRDTIVLGKYLGGMLSLFPIVVVSLVAALLVAFSSSNIAFDGNDIAHVVLIFAVSLLYVSTWYLLGLLLSIWTREATTTLILSMFIWVVLTSVHANVATFAVTKFSPHKPESEKEIFFQTNQLWDEFRKERDDYLKRRGYDSPRDTVSWRRDADGRRNTSAGTSSSSSEWFVIESYHIGNIGYADVSVLQEFLSYQEPLRIVYTDRVEEILNKPAGDRERNRRFANALSRVSFADVYHFAVGALAGTDRERYNDFIESSKTYRREVVEYLKDKKAFSSRAWFSNDQGAADLEGLPVFRYQRLSVSESFSRASVDILILLAWNVVLFMLAYVSFLRYEMS